MMVLGYQLQAEILDQLPMMAHGYQLQAEILDHFALLTQHPKLNHYQFHPVVIVLIQPLRH